MKAVAIVSGGLDSTTLAYRLYEQGYELSLLSFDYGQRHAKELAYAERTAVRLGEAGYVPVSWYRVDLSSVTGLLGGSALVGDRPVPEGHYAEASMSATVVPNRNMMMLSIAIAHAVAIGANVVATGVHAGDHFIYPDCRPSFISAMQVAMEQGNDGFLPSTGLHIEAPFLYWSKKDIAVEASTLGVPLGETWSCYQGGDVHCGRCGTCCERREAITMAGLFDPTPYADRDFWRQAATEREAGLRP